MAYVVCSKLHFVSVLCEPWCDIHDAAIQKQNFKPINSSGKSLGCPRHGLQRT